MTIVGTRSLRLGVAGPVGTGKSSLIAMICREMAAELNLGVITNDIYTDEDARFLRSAGVLDPERIRAVETGACPHTAIRDDVTANLLAVEDLEADFAPLDVVLVESGRRQPDGDLLAGAGRRADLRARRRRWRGCCPQGRTGDRARGSVGGQQDRPRPVRRGGRAGDDRGRQGRPGWPAGAGRLPAGS